MIRLWTIIIRPFLDILKILWETRSGPAACCGETVVLITFWKDKNDCFLERTCNANRGAPLWAHRLLRKKIKLLKYTNVLLTLVYSFYRKIKENRKIIFFDTKTIYYSDDVISLFSEHLLNRFCSVQRFIAPGQRVYMNRSYRTWRK